MPHYVEFGLRSKELPGYQGKYVTRWTNETSFSGAFGKLGLHWIESHTDSSGTKSEHFSIIPREITFVG